MNEEQFVKLQTGDVVMNLGSLMQYRIVETINPGSFVTHVGIATCTLTNPTEWGLVSRPTYRYIPPETESIYSCPACKSKASKTIYTIHGADFTCSNCDIVWYMPGLKPTPLKEPSS